METAFCIYSKKDETNASFKAREHIIPKCIGGIECLPLGWVSDEVNNEFSALELEFARNNPLITINRMFETKTGRKKHKNREKIILFKDEDEYGLGYIVEGRPITIDCIKCKNLFSGGMLKTNVSMDIYTNISLNLRKEEFFKSVNNRLISVLTEIKSKGFTFYRIIRGEIPFGEVLIGVYNHEIYLAFSSYVKLDDALISLLNEAIDKMFISNKIKTNKKNSKVECYIEFKTNMYECFRVYAKIAFNALAQLKGNNFILDESFDEIRDAILFGNNIQKFVYFNEGPNILKLINDNTKTKNIFSNNNKFHSICFISKDKILYGLVFLYGDVNPITIILSKNYNGNITDGYICDWINKKEGKIENFVVEFCNLKNQSLLKSEQM